MPIGSGNVPYYSGTYLAFTEEEREEIYMRKDKRIDGVLT